MLLTIMDLWVALDKCTIHQESLLREYESGFPTSLFDPLLLPKRAQMERLAHVERYIRDRERESTHSSSFIFRDTHEERSLAVQYIQRSRHHQDLRREIESAATLKRAEKRDELAQKVQQHCRLIREYEAMDHEEEIRWRNNREYTYHIPHCEKCRVKNEADDLEIFVHEWPLPYIELKAKSAVFELDVPVAIIHWQNITYTLLVDVFSSP